MRDEAKNLYWTRIAILGIAFALLAIGISFVHSTMAAPGESFPGRVARGQIVKAIAAIVVCILIARLDYRRLASVSYLFYLVMLVVLVVLLATRGPQKTARWVDLGFMSIQPSELAKASVILCLACYLRFRESHGRVMGLLVPYVLVMIPMGLVAMQPDLGTSLMLPPILLSMLFVAGARLWPLIATASVGALALPLIYLLRNYIPLLRGYQMDRVTQFFEQSDLDQVARHAYQLYQSLIALGSGGLTGKGLGQGDQNKLDWLPEKQTDFIFSVIGEEWGFVGGLLVATLFVALVYCCLRVAWHTREPFGRLVATGVGVSFAAQAIQNIGMTMGLTPITGLPLPFVSFGGSSLVSSCFLLGLVVSVARVRVRVVASADLAPAGRPGPVAVQSSSPAGALSSRWHVG